MGGVGEEVPQALDAHGESRVVGRAGNRTALLRCLREGPARDRKP